MEDEDKEPNSGELGISAAVGIEPDVMLGEPIAKESLLPVVMGDGVSLALAVDRDSDGGV